MTHTYASHSKAGQGNPSPAEAVLAQLHADLQAVEVRLRQSLQDLDGPLGELVRPQVQEVRPFVRAGVVLIAAYCLAPTPENVRHREPLLALASAIEMLYIALTIHMHLVQTESDAAKASAVQDVGERAYLGGAILAGDYCFSQASQLAAKTENPRVVAHFAQTLQVLSEGLLRKAFHAGPAAVTAPSGNRPFDEDRTLMLAGVEATFLLHDITHVPRLDAPDDYLISPKIRTSSDGAARNHTAHHEDAASSLATTAAQIWFQAQSFVDWHLQPSPGNDASEPKQPHRPNPRLSAYWMALRHWRQQAHADG
jgi:hypothetical protein